MDIQIWLQQIVNGLTLGAVYALIAVGYTMVYGVLQMINFAHGEVFMVGAFAGYYTLSEISGTPVGDNAASAILLAMLAGILASAVLSVALERIAYRPLRRAPRLAPLISAIGASIFLQNVMLRRTNGRPVTYPDLFPRGTIEALDVRVTYIQLFLFVMALVFMAGLYWFIRYTRAGKSIRAVSEDKDTAALMGVDVDRAIVTTFVVGAALAGAVGVMFGLWRGQARFDMGFIPGIKAFTAAVLGGIGNIPGAMLGGFFLGLVETLSVQAFASAGYPEASGYRDAVAFAVLVLVLIFRPAGILGEEIGKKRA